MASSNPLRSKSKKTTATTDPPEAIPVPERPRFYPEQSLTDGDLNAAVPWADARLRLSRYRGGRGVVFGLGLSVKTDAANAEKQLALVVDRGYAVGGRGEDIVVPASHEMPLEKVCKGIRGTPCGPASGQPSKDDVVVRDLYLAQKLEPAGAAQVIPCPRRTAPRTEHNRTKEGYRLVLRPGPPLEPPSRWTPPWKTLLDDFGTLGDAPTSEALAGWFKRQKVARFPVFHTLLKEWNDTLPARWPNLLSLLVIDAGSAGAAPVKPRTPRGVRLARVWLLRSAKLGCRILAVDQTPPFRRPYGPDLPPGALDLRPYIGAEWGLNAVRLEEFGGVTRAVDISTPTNFRRSLDPASAVWYALPGQKFRAVVFDFTPFDKTPNTTVTRILGFVRGNGAAAGEQGTDGNRVDAATDIAPPPHDAPDLTEGTGGEE